MPPEKKGYEPISLTILSRINRLLLTGVMLMAFKMSDGLLFCGRFADELPQFAGITIKAVMVSVTLFMMYALWVYVTWIENNSGNVPRSQSGSPSNLRMPLPEGCPFRRDLRGEATEKIVRGVSLPAKSRAKGLTDRSMDHVFLSFTDYLWFQMFVANPLCMQVMVVFTYFATRRFLYTTLLDFDLPTDFEHKTANIILDTSAGLLGLKNVSEIDGKSTAEFEWKDFKTIDNIGNTEVHERLYVKIDLESKSTLVATLGEVTLTARELLTVFLFYVTFAVHPLNHAYSNWGLDVESSNPFIRRMSITTVGYNRLGYDSFTKLLNLFRMIGILRLDIADETKEYISEALKRGVSCHQNIHQIAKPEFSRLGYFVTKIRSGFMKTFAKYQSDFPGIDGEALFQGTILHSLDHISFEEGLDPLWLDVNHPTFGAMAEVVLVSNVGFTSDVVGVHFQHKFKDAPHPFYREIYEMMKKVDPELADKIDTCIIK
jgi:hypothetical protein